MHFPNATICATTSMWYIIVTFPMQQEIKSEKITVTFLTKTKRINYYKSSLWETDSRASIISSGTTEM